MANLVMQALLNICTAVTEGTLAAAYIVHSYLSGNDLADIQRQVQAALVSNLQELIDCITEEFGDSLGKFVLNQLQERLHTPKQGVYLGILIDSHGTERYYVGSSYGQHGLQKRIFENHLRKSFRNDPWYHNKALYHAMAEPEVKTYFVPLALFEERVDTGLILLVEAQFASIFGAWRHYANLRAGLPPVIWTAGLNNSDPLTTAGHQMIGADATLYNRMRTLNNAKKAGEVMLNITPKRETSYLAGFSLFSEEFRMPKKVVEEWGIVNTVPMHIPINVKWDISVDTHPHKFALKCKNTDEGRRLGIRVSKVVRGEEKVHWLTRTLESAVVLADTLVDLFEDRIVGKQYDWDAKPTRYIFGQRKEKDFSKPVAEGKKKRRVGYDLAPGEFEWAVPDRPLETMPAANEAVRQERKRKRESRRTMVPVTRRGDEDEPFMLEDEAASMGKIVRVATHVLIPKLEISQEERDRYVTYDG